MAPKFLLFTERNVVIFIRLHGEEIYFGEKQPPDLISLALSPRCVFHCGVSLMRKRTLNQTDRIILSKSCIRELRLKFRASRSGLRPLVVFLLTCDDGSAVVVIFFRGLFGSCVTFDLSLVFLSHLLSLHSEGCTFHGIFTYICTLLLFSSH